MSLGIGIGVGLGPLSVGSGGILALAPDEITSAALAGWWDSEHGTMRAGMYEFGASAPDVTLSGTLTYTADPPEIFIEIDAGGDESTATMQWSLGGVVQATGVSISSPVALTGTGLTATFAAGTYTTSHSYRNAVAVISDRTANGNDFDQSVSGTQYPTIVNPTAALNDQPSHSMSNSLGQNQENATFAALNGTNTPFDAWLLTEITNISGGVQTLWCVANASNHQIGCRINASKYEIRRLISVTDNIETSDITAATGLALLRFVFDGTNGWLELNDAEIIAPADMSIGSAGTFSVLNLNVFHGSSFFARGDQRWAELAIFDAPLSASDAAALRAYFIGAG